MSQKISGEGVETTEIRSVSQKISSEGVGTAEIQSVSQKISSEGVRARPKTAFAPACLMAVSHKISRLRARTEVLEKISNSYKNAK